MKIAGKTAVAIFIFILGLAGGYFLASYRLLNETSNATAAKKLGPWQATFKLPATLRVPLENPVLVLEFKKHEGNEPEDFDKLKLTITNLTLHAFSVQLSVYGYDSRYFRIGGDIKRFSVRPGENLSRELEISTYLGAKGTLGLPPTQMPSSYALSVEAEEQLSPEKP